MTMAEEYDLFLSHAGEDSAWCEMLAERLRNEGVRVWFDKWELEPGDHLLARINDGIRQSRKMVAVWTPAYFHKAWTQMEAFSAQHPDVLAQDRPLIPILRADCDIPPTLRNLVYIDFRNDADFDLRVRQLIQALDLPRREFVDESEWREVEIEPTKRGRLAQVRGKRFEDEVATLYRLLGFEITQDTQINGVQIDLQIQKREGGLTTQAIVECKDLRVTSAERDQILAQQNIIQRVQPRWRWVVVSSQGFSADARAALESAGIDCTTYAELLRELVPLDSYADGLIREFEEWMRTTWNGEDWFIRPDVQTDITYETRPALTHLSKWLGDNRTNLLVVLGDLGTGKSTLVRFLAYHLAKSFRADPLRHPAPVLIPLREVRKEISLEGIVISHFARRGLPAINFPRLEHLVRLGKIIILFDAFDEMADRVRWDVTKSNFTELRRAAEDQGKVILTCRTHYFKDRTEQVKLIGEGPRLSEIETELYRELRQQSGAEVVYLQEFDDAKIQAYLRKARPHTAQEDWSKIQNIYNLRDLATRPLLLDMIVKSLPKLQAGQSINAASLYTVYTNIWIEREEAKGRLLDKTTKARLMLELAWRMWNEEKSEIHYRDLVPFVQALQQDRIVELDDEEAEDIAREMQGATFLKRDDKGNFAFMHRSFMEYFLARRIYETIADGHPPTVVGMSRATLLQTMLNTRRFDRKVIYFLALLDEKDQLREPLQQILVNPYTPNVSENALQILYWSARIRAGMEEEVKDRQALHDVLRERIPSGVQLAGANLQEMVLEGAFLHRANLSGADLTQVNFNHANLQQVNFHNAKLVNVRAEEITAKQCDFRAADLTGLTCPQARWFNCDFTAALVQPATFATAQLEQSVGLVLPVKFRREDLQAIVQRGASSGVNCVCYSPDGKLIASAGDDAIIRIYRAEDGKLVRTLEGHQE
ncbi:MAG: TIR domain-containing protein, partial [Anaerolineae bacterium]|nr:TIR domain-containing protein [Anaerolineae bacterium]